MNAKHLPYQDWAKPVTRPNLSSRSGIQTLIRGHNNQVDAFLDMLEKGAFDALGKKVLQALQIAISQRAETPSHVVESYTFTFSYQTTPEGGKTLENVSMQDPTGAKLTVKNVRYAISMFVRRLVHFCSTLPGLPEKRYMHMTLYYTEDCDPNYDPPGFNACDDTLWFGQTQNWKKATADGFGVLDAGYHAYVAWNPLSRLAI